MAFAATSGDSSSGANADAEKEACVENDIPRLLAPSDKDAGIPSIRLGETIRFEHWGPIILNTDGTTRLIANWDILTEQEKKVTWRRIGKRNEERRLVLLDQMKEQENEP
eukprot:CAMPEP_0198143058 /NCGR_PEP_ID=MMETSP1443-20131203/5675_1 /TAXON_ID=186043 /ORGANISM="Entomoneis sp., Strain CCMP2396" /LENGTH=109 /DNA_ID=CAMNT_0043806197 /DNA_START=160 /DNA_END=489 /DNA_ORIENTATION=+